MLQNQRPFLASYCLVQVKDAILVQRRANTGYLDGFWALPSGHVHEGEDAVSAASRELAEETGLIVEPQDWRFVCVMHRRTDREIIDLFLRRRRLQARPGSASRTSATALPSPRVICCRPHSRIMCALRCRISRQRNGRALQSISKAGGGSAAVSPRLHVLPRSRRTGFMHRPHSRFERSPRLRRDRGVGTAVCKE